MSIVRFRCCWVHLSLQARTGKNHSMGWCVLQIRELRKLSRASNYYRRMMYSMKGDISSLMMALVSTGVSKGPLWGLQFAKMLGNISEKCPLIMLRIQSNSWLPGNIRVSHWLSVSTSPLPRIIWPKKVFEPNSFERLHRHWVTHSYCVIKLVEMTTCCSMAAVLQGGQMERLFKAQHGVQESY